MNKDQQPIRRRTWLASAAAGLATLASDHSVAAGVAGIQAADSEIPADDYRVVNGRAKQSVMAWCFNPMPMATLVPACARMGLLAMEGIDAKHYPLMKQHGLGVSLCGSHGFKQGPFSKSNHQAVEKKLRDAIDLAVEWNSPAVITFTGMRESGTTDKQGFRNCVDCWKRVIGYAEDKGINLALEMLNTRDDSHPMKGHPGYFGDDIDRCVDMIKAVDSPRMKLLFDIYHVQIMHGDVIRRFRDNQDCISHVHTAGNTRKGRTVMTRRKSIIRQ
jgi:hydroxypyruvate isomerase